MTSLAERAAAAAGRTSNTPTDDGPVDQADALPAPEIDMSGYEVGDQDPEMVPVHLAWLRVRRDVGAIAKNQQYNGGGTRFNFRGVDTVVNTFGPITLKHGISVFPIDVRADHRDTTSKANSKMHECTVRVTWLVMGPMGDTLPPLTSCGEALDAADKATAKAQSVALRVLLLTGGLTPTTDPDPDSSYVERGEAPQRQPASYLDEILDPVTSRQRLAQINYEIKQAGIAGALITNETGAEEALGAFLFRIGQERFAAAGGGQ
jgi:hypothetical protein